MRHQLTDKNKVILVALTQIRENYGAHSWDGKDTCPEYWKNKGGNEYVVMKNLNQKAFGFVSRSRKGLMGSCVDLFNKSVPKDKRNNDYWQEYVTGYIIYFTSPSGNFVYEDDRGEIIACNSSLDKALKTTEVGKKLEYNLGDNIDWENDYIRNEKEASLC